MRTLQNNEIVLSETDIIDLIQSNPERHIRKLYVQPGTNLPQDNLLDLPYYPKIDIEPDAILDSMLYDRACQDTWLLPQAYQEFDIAQHILDLAVTEEQRQRVGVELLLFHERGMFPLLRYLHYLVSTMRDNNIVWGVGRGSSVASYVLYLLGVHKIDSLYYDLDINEFLKPFKNSD